VCNKHKVNHAINVLHCVIINIMLQNARRGTPSSRTMGETRSICGFVRYGVNKMPTQCFPAKVPQKIVKVRREIVEQISKNLEIPRKIPNVDTSIYRQKCCPVAGSPVVIFFSDM
jgi:hypothetical protein